jgi:hypothetical protein
MTSLGLGTFEIVLHPRSRGEWLLKPCRGAPFGLWYGDREYAVSYAQWVARRWIGLKFGFSIALELSLNIGSSAGLCLSELGMTVHINRRSRSSRVLGGPCVPNLETAGPSADAL